LRTIAKTVTCPTVTSPRRRGYATEILRQALTIANAHGIDPVLVTCDDTNIASATVIERCGGELESIFEVGLSI
jgi:predicted acetyltransferase